MEGSIIFIRCLSHRLFLSLLFFLLFFLGESSLEVLDNAFFFLLFRSVTLSLLMKGTLSLCCYYTDHREPSPTSLSLRQNQGHRAREGSRFLVLPGLTGRRVYLPNLIRSRSHFSVGNFPFNSKSISRKANKQNSDPVRKLEWEPRI